MAIKEIKFNPAQLKSVILSPKFEYQVWGRGTGKSNIAAWKVQRIVKSMPRSSSVITGKTYTQLLQRTLPPLISFMEKHLGYRRNKSYFLGTKPPDSWTLPFEPPAKEFDRYLTFGTPYGAVGFHLASQDREGSGRGLNTDFEITDETLTIDIERYNREISATNRANLKEFGHIPFHNGAHHSTSMPYTTDGKWILEMANYYHTERGVRLFDTWNRIVKMQIELLDIVNPKDFAAQWNEINRVKQTISPFISKDGVLFSLANAFDNIDNVGFTYIKEQRKKLPYLTFLIEIMNFYMDKVEDAYYQFQNRHFYYDSYNYSFIDSLDYNFAKLGSPSSQFDADCDAYSPILVVTDLGANISVLLSCQVNSLVDEGIETFNFLKEFYVKPEIGKVMIDELVDSFCQYYKYHHNRTVILFKDKYGDEGRANSSDTYNDQVIKRFIVNGWNVSIVDYPGKEPPHHEKYLLWANILKENSKGLPKVRINGNNCKSFIIALNNTRVLEKDNKFSKDKRSEHKNSRVPQEEATHSTDAADKIMWIYVNYYKNRNESFIAARI